MEPRGRRKEVEQISKSSGWGASGEKLLPHCGTVQTPRGVGVAAAAKGAEKLLRKESAIYSNTLVISAGHRPQNSALHRLDIAEYSPLAK
jgi:hypothetical protein